MSFRRVLYVLAWVVALLIAGQRLYTARHAFDNRPAEPDRHRRDGNGGHAQIDFGGQWVLARLVVVGYADRLYDRQAQWEIVRTAFPRSAASDWVNRESFPKAPGVPLFTDNDPRHDDDWMMYWFMGRDSPGWDPAGRAVALPFASGDPISAAALVSETQTRLTPELVAEVNRKRIGGPLYPPIQAFLYAPLALDKSPQTAYFAFQWVTLGITLLAGLGVSVLTRHKVWWPVATTAIMLYPGYRAGLELGQNPVLTLAILVWGWALAARGRDGWGGAVWGLLAFKPVWGATFLLLPLLQRRWRFCRAMVLTGATLAAATLPFVGLHTWLDWLEVGKEASVTYLWSQNWITLSRDLFGIPRRTLTDFSRPLLERNTLAATASGWLLWGLVFVPTIGIYLRRGDRKPTGLAAGFLALGAFLCCYRFMYYDALLSFFGLALLFAEWDTLIAPPAARWLHRWADAAASPPVIVLVALFVLENVLPWGGQEVELPWLPGQAKWIGYGPRYPWDTVLAAALWAWAGWKLWRRGRITESVHGKPPA
jgi:hypothetical protein